MNKTLIIFIIYLVFVSLQVAAKIQVEIITDESNPPYTFVENGQAVGAYVDFLTKAMINLKDYEVKFVPRPWKRGLSEIETGDALAILPPYKVAGRNYLNTYSEPLYIEKVKLFCNREISNKNNPSLENFKNFKIAVNRGFLLSDDFQAAKNKGVFEVIDGDDNQANLQKLFDHKVDCFANDELSTFFTLKKMIAINSEFSKPFFSESMELVKQPAFIGFGSDSSKFPFKNQFIKLINKEIVSLNKKSFMKLSLQKYR